ncbi:hypothetical protein Rsub_02697 [Raphidocelis subcapitata]|uniref:Uncharacterized protein n=1 Tax=Raphidocelis subcapitata TaxID=307507 RepID=A0A2V0NQS9_9CHLO|nr:hypothetical protein Rsub_02697 [Raphidocelis subcapitata]|eukprot:GBF89991.1 hypothetical protein Rsub_02697 [Raphidocelis subcapitata]
MGRDPGCPVAPRAPKPAKKKRRARHLIAELEVRLAELQRRVTEAHIQNARARLETDLLRALVVSREALLAACVPEKRPADAAAAAAALSEAMRQLSRTVHGGGGGGGESGGASGGAPAPALDAPALIAAIGGVRASPKAGATELRASWRERMREAAAVIAAPGGAQADQRVVEALHGAASLLIGHCLCCPWAHELLTANLITWRPEPASHATWAVWVDGLGLTPRQEAALLELQRHFERQMASLRSEQLRRAAAVRDLAASGALDLALEALDDLAAANAWMPVCAAAANVVVHAALLTPRQMLWLYVNAAPAWVPGVTALLDAVERRAAAGAPLPAAPAAAVGAAE